MPGPYDDTIAIGELSHRTGVSVRALRHYEQNDLLDAVRTSAGHRRFRPADVERVRRIRVLLGAGLPLVVVSQVIPCFLDEGARLHSCVGDYLRAHLKTVQARIEKLGEQQDTIRSLQRMVVP